MTIHSEVGPDAQDSAAGRDFPRQVTLTTINPEGCRFEITNPTESIRVEQAGHEAEYTRLIMQELKITDVLFDIGACVGFVALHAAPRAGRVIAFEPDPYYRSRFEANLALNAFRNVEVVDWAVGDDAVDVTLYTDNAGGPSPCLRQVGRKSTARVRMNSIDRALAAGSLPAPDVVKLDVEGAEVLALRGMRHLLESARAPRAIFIEIHPEFLPLFGATHEEPLAFLRAAGYRETYGVSRGSQVLHIFRKDPDPLPPVSLVPGFSTDTWAQSQMRVLDPEEIARASGLLDDLAHFGIDHLTPAPDFGWNYVLDHVWLVQQMEAYLAGRPSRDLVVLDVGCGRSRYHDFLEARLGIDVIGIDRPTGFGHVGELKNVDYCVDFLELTAFPDNSADVIFWLSSIEHNEPDVMRQLYLKSMRILKEGGLFLATIALSEKTHWHEQSEQTNLAPSDCLTLFDVKSLEGDLLEVREKYRKNLLLLKEKYQRRYGRFGDEDPAFITAGVKKLKGAALLQQPGGGAVLYSRTGEAKVLFFIEPMLLLDEPYLLVPWWHFTQRLISALESAATKRYSFRVIMSEAVEARLQEQGTSARCRIATISQEALLRRFAFDQYQASLAWYRRTYSHEQLEYSACLVKDTLDDWSPTAVITFSPAPYVQAAFPDAVVLHHEYGMTSRPPFPESFYFDPEGMYKDSYPVTHKEKIRHAPIHPSQARALERYRGYFVELIEAHNPFSGFLAGLKGAFDHRILVPLQASRTYWFDGNAEFTSQLQFAQSVLSSVPHSTGVVFCPHPDYPALTPDVVSYLQTKYPHFVYSPEFEAIRSASQYLIGHVDAVASVSSMVGLQAMIWKKKIISVGSGQLSFAADSDGLADIEEVLRRAPADRDNVLLWLLTRYYIPGSYLFRPGWFSTFLDKAIGLHGRGEGYDALYDPMGAADTVIDEIIRSAIPQIPVANSAVRQTGHPARLEHRYPETQEPGEEVALASRLQGEAARLAGELDRAREDAASSSALAHSAALELGQLQEQIRILNGELAAYRTGVLSSFFHWARDWANRRLPQGSRRRKVAHALTIAFVVLVSQGPVGLLRLLRRQSLEETTPRDSRELDS